MKRHFYKALFILSLLLLSQPATGADKPAPSLFGTRVERPRGVNSSQGSQQGGQQQGQQQQQSGSGGGQGGGGAGGQMGKGYESHLPQITEKINSASQAIQQAGQ